MAVAHPVRQAAAGDVLDDHVRRALELAEVVDVDDVRVAEPGDRLGLVPEAGDRARIGGDRLHDLDRARSLELRVIGAVHHAHRALAYEVLDLVLAQTGPCGYRHGLVIIRRIRANSCRLKERGWGAALAAAVA